MFYLQSEGLTLHYLYLGFFFRKYTWVLREANTFTNPGHSKGIKSTIIDIFCYVLYQKADFIIANSPDTKKDIIEKCIGINEKRIIALPNPVFSEKDIRYKDNIIPKNKSKKIISVGRLVPQKNYPGLIDAIYILKQKNYYVQLDIYGEGFLEEELKRRIGEKDLDDYVTIKPFEKNIVAVYPSYDLFVLNSKWEGFGNVLVEAMNCGLPIVSTNCPGGPQFILPKKSKMVNLVAVDNPVALSNAIREMFARDINAADVNDFIEHSLHFSIENVCSQYLNVINNAINNKKPISI